MVEKRRDKRIKADLKLNISHLFKQDNVKILNINSPIEVVNVSRGGIGFISESTLPVGYYFNASLQLGSQDDTLYCVVKIVRCNAIAPGNTYSYGCEIVGMPSILNYIFDDYEARMEQK
jgi:hypothetical protein